MLGLLTPTDPSWVDAAQNDLFGNAVAIGSDIALVAARDECAEAVDRIVTFTRSL